MFSINKILKNTRLQYRGSSNIGVVIPFIILIVLIAISIFAWSQAKDFVSQQEEAKFNDAVHETVVRTEDALKEYVDILYGARGLFAASQDVRRDEWQAFINASDIQNRFTGIQALEFISKITQEERSSFVEQVRLDDSINSLGYPDFDIYPEGDREEYFVVDYIEPFEGNEKAFGFDLKSEPSRYAALRKARDTGLPVVTAPITLVQETETQAGFLIFLSVYENGMSLDTVGERREALSGFVLAVFRAGDLLNSILKKIRPADDLHIEVYDTLGSEEEKLMLFHHKHSDVDYQPLLSVTKKVNVADRVWVLDFSILPKFDIGIANKFLPTGILIFGLLLSFFIFYILYSFVRIKEKAVLLAQELTVDLKKFQMAVEGASEHIMFTDADGVILYANTAAEKITGYLKDEMIGERPSLWGNKMSKEFYVKMWKTIKEDKKFFSGEVKNKRKNGEEYIAELRISPILDEENNVKFFVGIERDITERKRIEQMKSDFVSLVSHQLKTPVAQMRGYVDNMLSGLAGELTDKQRQYLLDMEEISLRNYRLISNLLNISQIERGIISMNIQPVNASEIVDIVVKEYREIAENKGLALNFNKPVNNIIINADKDKTVEVLNNIVNNAIKSTDKGSIIITIKSDNKYGIVEVKDTGNGMSKDTIGHLFEKREAFKGTPTAGGGSGLGLYIAKSFIKQQHGNIEATSIIDKGSVFTIRIPLSNI